MPLQKQPLERCPEKQANSLKIPMKKFIFGKVAG